MFNKHGRPHVAGSDTSAVSKCWPDCSSMMDGRLSLPPTPSPHNPEQSSLLHNGVLFFRVFWQSEPHAARTFILLSEKCGINEVIRGYNTRLTWQKGFNVWSLHKQSAGQGYGNLFVGHNKWHMLALLAKTYTGEHDI